MASFLLSDILCALYVTDIYTSAVTDISVTDSPVTDTSITDSSVTDGSVTDNTNTSVVRHRHLHECNKKVKQRQTQPVSSIWLAHG